VPAGVSPMPIAMSNNINSPAAVSNTPAKNPIGRKRHSPSY